MIRAARFVQKAPKQRSALNEDEQEKAKPKKNYNLLRHYHIFYAQFFLQGTTKSSSQLWNGFENYRNHFKTCRFISCIFQTLDEFWWQKCSGCCFTSWHCAQYFLLRSNNLHRVIIWDNKRRFLFFFISFKLEPKRNSILKKKKLIITASHSQREKNSERDSFI